MKQPVKKKLATLALAAAMLTMLCFSTEASAAEADGMIPVAVNVPESWEAPHLWAWADDGTNAFDAWPGEEMESLEDGWYYAYVPDYVQNVIVNANNGTDAPVQTEGVALDPGVPVWITVGEDAAADVSYEAENTAEIPKYVERFLIHAYVPLAWKSADLWAWSAPDGTNAFEQWPGLPMTEGEDGWFTAKAPVWVNSIIVSGNEGTVQTEDIPIESRELWVKVYEDLSFEISYEDPDKTAEDITVRAKVPQDWTAPSCWAWSAPDGTNAFASWPGEAFTQEDGWYTISVPGWINSVIVNAQEGAVQTSDLSVEPGKDIWIVVADAENAAVTYEEPEDADAVEPQTPSEGDVPEAVEAPAETEASAEPEEQSSGHVGAAVGIAALAAVAAGGAAVAVSRKKKK